MLYIYIYILFPCLHHLLPHGRKDAINYYYTENRPAELHNFYIRCIVVSYLCNYFYYSSSLFRAHFFLYNCISCGKGLLLCCMKFYLSVYYITLNVVFRPEDYIADKENKS